MNRMQSHAFTLCSFFLITSFVAGFKNEMQTENLPEYSEYMRRLRESSGATTEGTTITTHSMAQNYGEVSPIIAPFPNFPPIQLCKESPTDIYGHVFCLAMFVIYILLVISLVIYQFRSFHWFKTKLTIKKQEEKSTQTYGHDTDQQNSFY